MSRDHWMIIFISVYVALFMIAVALFVFWKSKQQKDRAPVAFKLLRGPGESLRRRMAHFDENIIFSLGGAALAPLLAAGLPVLILQFFKPTTWPQLITYMVTMAVLFVVTLVFSFRWAASGLVRYRNDRLGYLGERAVGEALQALYEAGYKIFHDVPIGDGKYTCNVDHVAVGPAGVFGIETKTRRKGRARPGFEDHKVAYDGAKLIWPWGEDDFGLRNAEDRSRILGEWLNKMTGLGLAIRPFLVLPGWYVVPKGIGPVTVVNHKQLVGAILRNLPGALTGEQVDLIARQLDERCRDVED